MIRLILVLSLFLLSLIGFSQTVEKGVKITVTVVNATSDKGTIHFALFNSETNFLSKIPMAKASENIQNGICKVEFNDVKPGFYAIICFHDANDNGKMDFEDNGMPLENYGLTNNVMTYGPPQFKDAKFEVAKSNLSFDIKF